MRGLHAVCQVVSIAQAIDINRYFNSAGSQG
jgi:hypothetical protein